MVGGPISVSGNFDCYVNKLASFSGFPIVSGYFNCRKNSLKNLEGCPVKVGLHYYDNQNYHQQNLGNLLMILNYYSQTHPEP